MVRMGAGVSYKLVWSKRTASERREFRLFVTDPGTLTIGRDASNDIAIDDKGISRHHAVLELRPERAVIADAGSRNGVLINGKKIAKAVWHPGQTAMLGSYQFEIERAAPSLVGAYRPLFGRGRFAQGFLLAFALTILAAIAVKFFYFFSFAESDQYKIYQLLARFQLQNIEVGWADSAMQTISYLHLAILPIALLSIVLWHFRATANLESFNMRDLSFVPGSVFLWWLPLVVGLISFLITTRQHNPVGLVMRNLTSAENSWTIVLSVIGIIILLIILAACFQVVRSISELWRASTPGIIGSHWRNISTPFIVLGCFFFAIALPFLIVLAEGAFLHVFRGIQNLDDVRENSIVLFGGQLLGDLSVLLGVFLLIFVIRRVSAMQAEQFRLASRDHTQFFEAR